MKGDILFSHGPRYVFGAPPRSKRITDAPPGAQIRVRFRQQSFAEAFVRTASGICRYVLEDHGDYWKLGFCTGENRTLQTAERIVRRIRPATRPREMAAGL